MKKILLVLLLSLVLILPGCGGGGSSNCNRPGFTPGVTYRIHYTFPAPSIPILERRVANSSGNLIFPSHGYNCNTGVFIVAETNSNLSLASNPSSVYLPGPPTSGTITGQSFDATYGLPMVEYFDSSGYQIGSVYATSVSGDGTSLQANLPDLSNAYSGTYQVRVTNKTYQGYYVHIVGSATITAWGRDRPDSDGDGWYDDVECDPYDPYRNSSCIETCGGGREPITICQPY